LHLSSLSIGDSEISNSKNSLYAGISLGKGKRVVLLAPKPFNAPIDYHDLLIEYENAPDCVIKLEKWLIKSVGQKKARHIQQKSEELELNLLKLGLGYSIDINDISLQHLESIGGISAKQFIIVIL
jgi:hypothetical protein